MLGGGGRYRGPGSRAWQRGRACCEPTLAFRVSPERPPAAPPAAAHHRTRMRRGGEAGGGARPGPWCPRGRCSRSGPGWGAQRAAGGARPLPNAHLSGLEACGRHCGSVQRPWRPGGPCGRTRRAAAVASGCYEAKGGVWGAQVLGTGGGRAVTEPAGVGRGAGPAKPLHRVG